MARNKITKTSRPLTGRDLSAACRELDAQGLKYVVVNGMTVIQQGFSPSEGHQDLVEQCSELNRRAVMPPPETLAGKTVREIAATVFP